MAPGCKLVSSIEQALDVAKQSEMAEDMGEIMICGGVSVYKQFLPLANRMYLTFIDHCFDGDTYFPEFDKNEWTETQKDIFKADHVNPYSYSFVTLERE